MKRAILIVLSLLFSSFTLKAECLYVSGIESLNTTAETIRDFQKVIDHSDEKKISFDDQVESRVESVVSLFENGVLSPVYEYIEDIHDGRGYTAGKVGFTSATGDLLDVVNEYLKLNPKADPAWSKLIPILKERYKHFSGDTKGLEDLPALWKKASLDPLFIEAQKIITNQLYKSPAKERMKQLKFHSALTYLVFYDTMVQHGDDPDSAPNDVDPDGFSGILKSMKSKPTNEKEFLKSFLESRRAVLMNSSTPETREAWRDSVTRVDALLDLINHDTWTLKGDVAVHIWNSEFKLP